MFTTLQKYEVLKTLDMLSNLVGSYQEGLSICFSKVESLDTLLVERRSETMLFAKDANVSLELDNFLKALLK